MVEVVLTHLGAAEGPAGPPCRTLPARVGIALSVLFGLGHGCCTSQPLQQEVSRAIESWHRPAFQRDAAASSERSGRAASESAQGTGTFEEGEPSAPRRPKRD